MKQPFAGEQGGRAHYHPREIARRRWRRGTTNLVDVFEYAEAGHGQGFVYMDTAGIRTRCRPTGQVAAGANMICFTTGRGSAYGCKPAPSLQARHQHAALRPPRKKDMDFKLRHDHDGTESQSAQAGERFFPIDPRNGLRWANEERAFRYGEDEFAPGPIGRRCYGSLAATAAFFLHLMERRSTRSAPIGPMPVLAICTIARTSSRRAFGNCRRGARRRSPTPVLQFEPGIEAEESGVHAAP